VIWLLLVLAYVLTGILYLQRRYPHLFSPDNLPATASTGSTLSSQQYVAKGDAALDAGNVSQALEAYQAAVAEDPDNAVAYARWAKLLAITGREEEALIRVERAVALAPDDPEVVAIYAMVLDWNGRYEEAIEQAFRAIDLDPDYAPAYAFLAEAYADSTRSWAATRRP